MVPLGWYNGYRRNGGRTFRRFAYLKQVQERVRRMGIVSAEWLETELPVHEYHGITSFEEILCGRCSTSSLKVAVNGMHKRCHETGSTYRR